MYFMFPATRYPSKNSFRIKIKELHLEFRHVYTVMVDENY
jgi:hypothetical protein